MILENVRIVDRRRPLPLALTLLGVVVVYVTLARQALGGHDVASVVLALVAAAAWVTHSFLPPRAPVALRAVLIVVMIVGGAVSASGTDVVGIVPAVGGILITAGSIAWPVGYAIVAVVLALAGAGVGAIAFPDADAQAFGTLSALLLTVLVSISRRQYRAGEQRSRELLEERVVIEQERARSAALAERSRIARDIHDVLAHSLGGLVLQLDAVEAELEAGRVDAALARVHAAHALASGGLDEARRAVNALRDPDSVADLSTTIETLIATHRSLGAEATLHLTGEAREVDADTADAFGRAAQEILSNARRHAPGARTDLELDRDALELRASTPLGPGRVPAGPGGGHGLLGLRERAEALGGSVTIVDGDPFVVRMRVPR